MRNYTIITVGLLMCLMTIIANGQTSDNEVNNKWLVSCNNQTPSGDLNCTMSQSIIDANTRKRIVSVRIESINQKNIMTINMPHGLYLPSGLSVNVDSEQGVNLKYVTADANGSYAEFELSELILTSMKKGKLINIKVQSRSLDKLNLQLSLDGFTKAYEIYKNSI